MLARTTPWDVGVGRAAIAMRSSILAQRDRQFRDSDGAVSFAFTHGPNDQAVGVRDWRNRTEFVVAGTAGFADRFSSRFETDVLGPLVASRERRDVCGNVECSRRDHGVVPVEHVGTGSVGCNAIDVANRLVVPRVAVARRGDICGRERTVPRIPSPRARTGNCHGDPREDHVPVERVDARYRTDRVDHLRDVLRTSAAGYLGWSRGVWRNVARRLEHRSVCGLGVGAMLATV